MIAPAAFTAADTVGEPPERRPDDLTPWPRWPVKLRTSYALKEGGERDFAIPTTKLTGDGKVASIALTAGAEVIRESAENGETGAVDFARLELKRAGCEAVLILPGDMPLVRADDIEALLAQVPPRAIPLSLSAPGGKGLALL